MAVAGEERGVLADAAAGVEGRAGDPNSFELSRGARENPQHASPPYGQGDSSNPRWERLPWASVSLPPRRQHVSARPEATDCRDEPDEAAADHGRLAQHLLAIQHRRGDVRQLAAL